MIWKKKQELIKEARDGAAERPVIGQTPGALPNRQLRDISQHIYTDEEIKMFDITEAIDEHPLAKKPGLLRSKLAYKELFSNLKATSKYLLPGQLVVFQYVSPKMAQELEYYDKTPLTLFFGLVRTPEGAVREIGINLHFIPPFARARVIANLYRAYKTYFQKNFNDPAKKPNAFITWRHLQHICKKNSKIAFAIRMYVPVLRGATYVIPTRMIPTAFYTEGNFSKATRAQIMKYWRQF